MARGGKRPGAGRKPGAATKKTREIADKAASQGITPIEYLLQVMRDGTLERADRVEAAKAAAPYVHPRLNAVDHQSSDGSMSERPTVIKLVAPNLDDGD